MNFKKIHYCSGLIITVFVGLHLFNHCYSLLGADRHIELMTALRHFYRNIFVETIIIMAVVVQIISGIKLFVAGRKTAGSGFEKLRLWTGFYLALFFVIHVGAVFAGRFLLDLDTNFYFGVAGLNSFPTNLFFIPYYGLAIIAFFGHIAALHYKKMSRNILGITPGLQAKCIIAFGVCLTVVIFYGLTNGFRGVIIPPAYKVLIGK
jgi:hypothetical protein